MPEVFLICNTGKDLTMTRNINRVKDSKWRSWNEPSRALFNNVYKSISDIGPALFIHPKSAVTPFEFKTIAWNAAWEAADQLQHPGVKAEIVA